MAKKYKGLKGEYYEAVEPSLGKGGEGTIYSISGNSNYVMKILDKQRRTSYRYEKLLAMIKMPISMLTIQSIVWPIDILFDDNDNFLGYVMKQIIQGTTLNMISSKTEYSLYKKLIIAKNLCSVLNSIHKDELICGDLNPSNIKVDINTGRVTLVDIDSFNVVDKDTGMEFRCEVGVPEYLPREIHELLSEHRDCNLLNLPKNPFSRETDLFALAVHIFSLLMNGCHPFSCSVADEIDVSGEIQSVSVPQPLDNIKSGYFPFYMEKEKISTPLYAPPFDFLPENLRNLFIRAFAKTIKDRPSAEEWYYELDKVEQHLIICSENHFRFDHNNNCFFCELKQLYKSNLNLAQDEYEPRLGCVLLLAPSEKFDQSQIHLINATIKQFLEETTLDELTRRRVDLSIIALQQDVNIIYDFTPICNIKPPVLSTIGGKNIDKALKCSIEMLQERNEYFSKMGRAVFEPVLVMISDANFDNYNSNISMRIEYLENKRKLKLWEIGLPNYNFDYFKNLSSKNKIVEISKCDFKDFFVWFSSGCRPTFFHNNIIIDSNNLQPLQFNSEELKKLENWD